MDHYTKLGVLGLRIFGVSAVLYALPMVLWGIVRVGASQAGTEEYSEQVSAVFGWLVYALMGGFLLLFARPLARIAARGLASADAPPPAA